MKGNGKPSGHASGKPFSNGKGKPGSNGNGHAKVPLKRPGQ